MVLPCVNDIAHLYGGPLLCAFHKKTHMKYDLAIYIAFVSIVFARWDENNHLFVCGLQSIGACFTVVLEMLIKQHSVHGYANNWKEPFIVYVWLD